MDRRRWLCRMAGFVLVALAALAEDSQAASCASAGTDYGEYPGISCGTYVGRTQAPGNTKENFVEAAGEVGIVLTPDMIIDSTSGRPYISVLAINTLGSPSGTEGVVTSSVPFTILGLKGGKTPYNYAFYVFSEPVTAAAFDTWDAGMLDTLTRAAPLQLAFIAAPAPPALWLLLSALCALGLASRHSRRTDRAVAAGPQAI